MTAFQIAIVIGVIFCSIYFEWGVSGLAAGVIGGMIALSATKLLAALQDKRKYGTPFFRWRTHDDQGRRIR